MTVEIDRKNAAVYGYHHSTRIRQELYDAFGARQVAEHLYGESDDFEGSWRASPSSNRRFRAVRIFVKTSGATAVVSAAANSLSLYSLEDPLARQTKL